MSNRGVAIIIVNYKSAKYTLRAIDSIEQAGINGGYTIYVVDNSEDEAEQKNLEEKLPEKVELIIPERNIGFGAACNLAYGKSRSDYIFLLNPDAFVLDGCIGRLMQRMDVNDSIGALSPLTYWDDSRKFIFTQLPVISPGSYIKELLLNASSLLQRQVTRHWRNGILRLLSSDTAVNQNNLSGGVVLLRREAIEKIGGLFDPRFFLYFEDADLFQRMKKAGYRLCIDPTARAVHNYNQTAKDETDRKARYFLGSQDKYINKYDRYGIARLIYRILRKVLPGKKQNTFQDLGTNNHPQVIDLPEQIRNCWLLELSPNDNFMPSAVTIGQGGSFAVPTEAWDLMAPGKYYIRCGGISSTAALWTWSFIKVNS